MGGKRWVVRFPGQAQSLGLVSLCWPHPYPPSISSATGHPPHRAIGPLNKVTKFHCSRGPCSYSGHRLWGDPRVPDSLTLSTRPVQWGAPSSSTSSRSSSRQGHTSALQAETFSVRPPTPPWEVNSPLATFSPQVLKRKSHRLTRRVRVFPTPSWEGLCSSLPRPPLQD